MSINKTKIEESTLKVEKWIEDHNYKGYEPFDGLSSFLFPLTLGNLFLERLLQQLVRQSPINLRPLFGVKPKESTKGRGYMSWGYLYMFQRTGNKKYKEKACLCLDWLDQNRTKKNNNHAWGNNFNYSSRGGRIPIYEPTIVWNSLIGQAFLEAYEILNENKYLDIANSICKWIIGIPREKTNKGTCLSYVSYEQSSIHNSNMLGAAMLAKTASITGNSGYLEVAKEAMKYSCADQLPDGAWYYGKDEKYHWIDNFHTGYNLDSLKRYIQYSKDTEFEENLQRGYNFLRKHFFLEDGTPKYYHNRVQPLDIQCASQGIDTLVFFSDNDPSALELATKVAKWTINNMQEKDGHFIYRKYPIIKANAPMIHWGQATMYKALTHLLLKI